MVVVVGSKELLRYGGKVVWRVELGKNAALTSQGLRCGCVCL